MVSLIRIAHRACAQKHTSQKRPCLAFVIGKSRRYVSQLKILAVYPVSRVVQKIPHAIASELHYVAHRIEPLLFTYGGFGGDAVKLPAEAYRKRRDAAVFGYILQAYAATPQRHGAGSMGYSAKQGAFLFCASQLAAFHKLIFCLR